MVGKGVLKPLEIVLISLGIFLTVGSASDRPDLLKNQSYNLYQGWIKCQPSDLGSDEVLAVGSCKRVLNTIGNEFEPSDLGRIESQPLDRAQDLILIVNHACGPRNYSCGSHPSSVDRPTDPPYTRGYFLYFLGYFSSIFAPIFS